MSSVTVTRPVWKKAKWMFTKGYSPKQVMAKTGLSNATVYRIRNSDSYRGKNGYFIVQRPPKNKYDTVMQDYIDMPIRGWWNKLKRKDKK